MFDFNETPRLAVDAKVIERKIALEAKASMTRAKSLHILLVACAHHMAENRDASLFDKLWAALANSVNKRGMSIWMREFTTLEFRKNKDGVFKWLGKVENKQKLYAFKLEGEQTPFYEMEAVRKDNEKQTFDLGTAVGHMLERAAKLIKSGKATPATVAFYNALDPVYAKTQKAQKEEAPMMGAVPAAV